MTCLPTKIPPHSTPVEPNKYFSRFSTALNCIEMASEDQPMKDAKDENEPSEGDKLSHNLLVVIQDVSGPLPC